MNKLDKNFEELIKTQKLNSPSDRFSINVMNKIYQLSSKIIYKPVIGKWGWFSIMVIFVAFIAYSVFAGSGSAESGDSVIMDRLFSWLPDKKPEITGLPEVNLNLGLIDYLKQVPSVFYFSIIGLSLLMMFDKLFLKERKIPNK